MTNDSGHRMACFRAGEEAYKAGKLTGDNPYPRGSEDWTSRCDGFVVALQRHLEEIKRGIRVE